MSAIAETQSQPFADQLFERYIAAMEVLEVHIGDRLGLYDALADRGALNSRALAAATGHATSATRASGSRRRPPAASSRWRTPESAALERRFSLPAEHAEVLVARDSLDYMAPIARVIAATTQALPQVLDAFRTGAGVPWTAYGEDGREAQSDQNRALFLSQLGSEWLPSIDDVHARLSEGGRVADVASGGGWSAIAMARAYPGVQVDGYDLDEASVELARANAAEYGVSDRVRFHVADASDPELAGNYDLVTIFEALHDVARPVELLQTLRRLAGDTGSVIVMDERVEDSFSAPASDVERLMYGFSVLLCLPTGMDHDHPVGTGTVMRADTVREYCRRGRLRPRRGPADRE